MKIQYLLVFSVNDKLKIWNLSLRVLIVSLYQLHDGNTLAEIKGFLIAMKQTTASIIKTSIMTLLHKVRIL